MTTATIDPAKESVSTLRLRALTVTCENPAPHARTDWVTFTVPSRKLGSLGDGQLMLGPFPAYIGKPVGYDETDLPDVVRVHARVSIGALQRQTWPLTKVPTTAPVVPNRATAEALSDAPGARPAVQLWINGESWDVEPTLSPDGPCHLLHMVGRVPETQCVGEFWATIYPGSQVVPWELLVVASDPSTPEVYQAITSIVLQIAGEVVVATYWPAWRGAQQINANSVELARNTTMADTQGLAWAGVVIASTAAGSGAALYGPICALVDGWDGHWGPFGRVPESVPMAESASYVDRLLGWHRDTLSTGDVWRRPRLGLEPNSGQTGAQDDFGATKLGWAFAGGPLAILEAYHSALHEACRPGHWRDADGYPVEPWNHPNHVTWDAYTHWHPSVSGDRLGKGSAATPRFSGGYIGPDREHWSNNLLCGTYLLTGSPLLRRIIEKQARQILSGETIDPRLSTSNAGAPRGVGRTLLSAAWIRRCLDQGTLLARVRERMTARLVIVERQTRPVLGAAPNGASEPRLCYTLDGELTNTVALLGTTEMVITAEPYSGAVGLIDDPRAMGAGVVCVATWQEALAIVGLRAAALDGDPNAAIVLARAAHAWMQHGWWEQDGRWWLADYVAYLDPSQRVRREGFEEWSTGALRICATILDGELAQRAASILASMPCTTVREAEWRATS